MIVKTALMNFLYDNSKSNFIKYKQPDGLLDKVVVIDPLEMIYFPNHLMPFLLHL